MTDTMFGPDGERILCVRRALADASVTRPVGLFSVALDAGLDRRGWTKEYIEDFG